MSSRLAHRGPNGSGIFVDRNIGLGHRRLAVIDIEGGQQPMTDPERGNVIVYNGEVFNFRELRRHLVNLGHRFRTNSDTEVLLKLANGPPNDWVRAVNGMFALAVWNPSNQTLTIVRDRFGVKPIYYYVGPDGVAFASEIKALFALTQHLTPRVNRGALAEYLAFRSITAPRTLFNGVKILPAGHFLELRLGNPRVTAIRYWDEVEELKSQNFTTSKPEDFDGAFRQAVLERLVSDVPLGTFNSGGVDSSLVTHDVRELTAGPLHTFSVGFDEPQFDESLFASDVAKRLGTTHHSLSLSAQEYSDLLPISIWHHDEPLCHPHTAHLYRLSQVAATFVTVVLTGEGADEVFAGYPRLHIARIGSMLRFARRAIGQLMKVTGLPIASRRAQKLADALLSPGLPAIESHRFVDRHWLTALGVREDYVGERYALYEYALRNTTDLEALLQYERLTYMQSLLVRLDKMTMAHGLEARTPFLDFNLVLWAKTLPESTKIGRGLGTKVMLKDIAARRFTHDLAHRPKIGFGVPLAAWMRSNDSLRDRIRTLSAYDSFVGQFFPRDLIHKATQSHLQGTSNQEELLWTLMNLNLWSKTFLVQS